MSNKTRNHPEAPDDDWWTGAVIGLIFCGVNLALWAPHRCATEVAQAWVGTTDWNCGSSYAGG